MNKKLLIIPLCLAVAFAIAVPWYKLEAKSNDIAKQQEILSISQSFVNTYGSNVKVNNFIEPQNIKLYAVSWSDESYTHVSLSVNGVWVEIARQELPKSIEPETENK